MATDHEAAAAGLPVDELRDELRGALQTGNRVVLSAPTGSGKSTRVPLFLLDSPAVTGQILVLQPRRLAASILAAYVAGQRGCCVGGEIGYQTRYEHEVSAATRVRFITDGILPRLLLADPALTGIGAVVFDEFHERSLAMDLSLALVRQLQEQRRPELKLVVMSATLDTEAVARFLPGAVRLASAGRQHPVDIRYLPPGPLRPPWDAAADALAGLRRAGAQGDVLIFMPGAHEIRRTIRAAAGHGGDLRLLPLYGELPPRQQAEVMAPAGGRKVIVATNIAETSLTIPGVRHVIDSGLARVNRNDAARGFNTLLLEPISQAAADQRAGRAGREGPGTCLRLWSAAEHARRPAFSDPEIRRVELAETVLQLRLLGFAAPDTFPWFEAPPAAAWTAAADLLVRLGALTQDTGAITELGRAMARLPLHPRLARLLLAAHERGALTAAIRLAAVLSERPLLNSVAAFAAHVAPPADAPPSDLLVVLAAVETARHLHFADGPCAARGINAAVARQILRAEAYFHQVCRRQGLRLDRRPAAPAELLKAVLLAFPDHLARRSSPTARGWDLRQGRRAELAPDSTVTDTALLVAAELRELGGAGQGVRLVLSLASGVADAWLRELFPQDWRQTQDVVWDDARQQVLKRTSTYCLDLLLAAKDDPQVDPALAEARLATEIMARQLPLAGWTPAVDAWINRVRWLAGVFPERGLIAYTEAETELLVRELCAGASRYQAVREKPVLPLAQNLLSFHDRQFVERLAPAELPLPSGRKLKLEYQPGQPPRGRAKIQDLYDLPDTPTVAGGRARVRLEILAPNQRPVQITDDLPGFWRNHYPDLKKTLARRYPKHRWR